MGPTFARKTRARALKTYADALSACTRSVYGMDCKDQPLSGRGARVKRRQPAPSAHAARRPQTDRTTGAAKQAAPRRICCTEMALSPPKIGSTASDPTCTRNTSSTSRSQMCARECTHPLRAIVRAGVQGWVLEQGKGSQQGATARGAWGRPARNPQAAHVSAAAAQDREADVLRAQSTRRSTIRTMVLAAPSGPP